MNEYSLETLKVQVENFITEKRLMGYRYDNEECKMNNFLKFVFNNQITPSISKDAVMRWVDGTESTVSRNHRISVIRQFALFLNRSGEQAYIVPAVYRSIERKDFCPYIYSRKELALIFQSADAFGRVGKIPCSEKSFPLILRMLYGCGLRISEALSLKVRHLNLRDGILIIKDTKFFKDRLIPMHENLTKRCLEYTEKTLVVAAPDDYFFPSGKSERIDNGIFYRYFRKLLSASGIRAENIGRGPRVHDMRHTFAVHCLKKLDNAGMDMNATLPILATYMGHTTYIGTGTYLHLTGELYPHVANLVEGMFESLIPQGGRTNEN